MKSKKERTSFIIPKNKKSLSVVLLVLTIIAFFFVIILGSVSSVIYDKGLYFREQEKNKVYENIDKDIAENVTLKVIRYFRYNEKLETDFFNENEVSHLQDVKRLMSRAIVCYYGSIILLVILFLLYYNITKNFSKSFTSILILGSIFTLVIFTILYFADFSLLFDKFHITFFESNYMFPADSNIIKLFPESFFNGMFITILKISLVKAIILLLAGIVMNSLDYFARIHARP